MYADVQVMKYYKHNFSFDYCAHGGRFKKGTTFWTTADIQRHEIQNPNGFQPLKCQGWKKCGAMISPRKHYPFEGLKLSERQSIPPQVSTQLGVAIAGLLQKGIEKLL